MFWGMLHPSLPPRPSFPKSPSPQENTKPNKHQMAGQTTITVLLWARNLLEQDIPTFVCQSKSLSISASTSNLNDSVAQEHFNLQSRKSKKGISKNFCFKTSQTFSSSYDWSSSLCPAWAHHLEKDYEALLTQDPTLLHDSGSFQLCIKADADMNVQNGTSHSTPLSKKKRLDLFGLSETVSLLLEVCVPKSSSHHPKRMSSCFHEFCLYSSSVIY